MRTIRLKATFLAAVVLLAESAEAADNAGKFRPMRAERLLPDSTVAMLSVPDCPSTIKKWSQAGFRPVWSNSALRTLFVQLEELLPKRWRGKEGFGWKKLLELPADEACLALAQTEAGGPAAIIVLACHGRDRTVADFFDRLETMDLPDRGPTKATVSDVEIIRYQSLSYFIKDGLLLATSDPLLTERLAKAWLTNDGLVGSEPWRAVMEQAEMDAVDADPDIRWFIRPQGFVNAFAKAKNSPVVAKIGLDLVQAAGGGCWIGQGEYAALCRVGVFAPDMGNGGRKSLLLPQSELHDPPEWVPATAAGYASFRCDLYRGIPAFGELVDSAMGEPGVFGDILAGVKNDPNGPRVDLDAELYRKFRSRVVVLWGPEQPGASAWTSCGFAMETGDEPNAVKVVDRLYAKDLGVKKRQADDADFFYREDQDRDEETPKVVPLDEGKTPKRRAESVSFVGVVHQCVLVGAGKELFASLSAPRKPLTTDPDYRRVGEALNRLAANPVSCRCFSRHGDDFRLLEQCATPLGLVPSLCGPAMTNSGQGTTAANSQPPEACPSNCGPGGWVAHPTPKGCRVVGCVLKPTLPTEKRK